MTKSKSAGTLYYLDVFILFILWMTLVSWSVCVSPQWPCQSLLTLWPVMWVQTASASAGLIPLTTCCSTNSPGSRWMEGTARRSVTTPSRSCGLTAQWPHVFNKSFWCVTGGPFVAILENECIRMFWPHHCTHSCDVHIIHGWDVMFKKCTRKHFSQTKGHS